MEKKGDWIPVHKKDNKMDIRNYRPVTVPKVFEQLLSTQVTSFIEPYLSKTMTACRKNHSRETTLLGQDERWKQNLDEKKLEGVLSTDMSKAFDSLHSPLLIARLRAYGFSDEALGLMRSYFCESKCREKLIQKQPVSGMKHQEVARKDPPWVHSYIYGMYSKMICITQ